MTLTSLQEPSHIIQATFSYPSIIIRKLPVYFPLHIRRPNKYGKAKQRKKPAAHTQIHYGTTLYRQHHLPVPLCGRITNLQKMSPRDTENCYKYITSTASGT